MKWFKLAFVLAIALMAVSVGTAQASTLFLSTTSTSPALINPTLTMTVGSTANLYVFWEPTQEQIGTDPYSGDPIFANEQLNGLGHNIVDSANLMSRVAYTFLNPTAGGSPRWGSTSPGSTSGTFLANGANLVKVGGSNLGFFTTAGQGYFVDAPSPNGVWRLGTLTLQCTGAGTSNLFFQVGISGISFQNSPNARPINFGFSDAAVASNSFNTGSTLKDATVIQIPVPEPGTLALLGMGVVGLVAIARRRKRSTA